MSKHYIATLLTDFGTAEGYVAAMKGAILAVCPRAQLVDISHDVPAHDILAAAMVLAQAAPHFPAGTLHVTVVDPGVGTERKILAARFGSQRFLFPDNGVITFVSESMPLGAIVSVRDPRYVAPGAASMTFHGRDILAPVAGHILNGLDIGKLGPKPDTYKTLDLPVPSRREGGLFGQVIHVDHFGNLISNISQGDISGLWPGQSGLGVVCAGRPVGPIQATYAVVEPGQPVALVNSMGLLEVGVNRGRACELLAAGVGAEIAVVESPSAAR
jgi:hypothetical protein